MGTDNPKLYSVPIAIKIRYGILNYSTNCHLYFIFDVIWFKIKSKIKYHFVFYWSLCMNKIPKYHCFVNIFLLL